MDSIPTEVFKIVFPKGLIKQHIIHLFFSVIWQYYPLPAVSFFYYMPENFDTLKNQPFYPQGIV